MMSTGALLRRVQKRNEYLVSTQSHDMYDVNPLTLCTLKNAKSIWSIWPGRRVARETGGFLLSRGRLHFVQIGHA